MNPNGKTPGKSKKCLVRADRLSCQRGSYFKIAKTFVNVDFVELKCVRGKYKSALFVFETFLKSGQISI